MSPNTASKPSADPRAAAVMHRWVTAEVVGTDATAPPFVSRAVLKAQIRPTLSPTNAEHSTASLLVFAAVSPVVFVPQAYTYVLPVAL